MGFWNSIKTILRRPLTIDWRPCPTCLGGTRAEFKLTPCPACWGQGRLPWIK